MSLEEKGQEQKNKALKEKRAKMRKEYEGLKAALRIAPQESKVCRKCLSIYSKRAWEKSRCSWPGCTQQHPEECSKCIDKYSDVPREDRSDLGANIKVCELCQLTFCCLDPNNVSNQDYSDFEDHWNLHRNECVRRHRRMCGFDREYSRRSRKRRKSGAITATAPGKCGRIFDLELPTCNICGVHYCSDCASSVVNYCNACYQKAYDSNIRDDESSL